MRRLLIIDDDESLRKMLHFRLQDSYDITDTASPKDGLVMALDRQPDAILVDLLMPYHSGFEVCQALRSLSFTEVIPVFVISGAPKGLYKDFCQTLGARGYFEKPIDFDLLKARLAAAVTEGQGNRRREPRISIRLGVKLQGIDQKGEPFEFLTSTENVSRHGFTCGINLPLQENATVKLFIWTRTAHRFAGEARLVRLDWPDTALMPMGGFRFIEEPREWIF